MSNITTTSGTVPVSRVPISTRLATMADVPFIDGLQRIHTHMVGWMPTKQIEGKIERGQVVVAEGSGKDEGGRMKDEKGGNDTSSPFSSFSPHPSSLGPIGYCISQDTYSGRDDVGIVYQLNVQPMMQRSLIGATLLKSVFERAAYGCRLFCCWCAQDIQANYFWESCGFVPLAFRTGSRGKQRIHIFWQRRVREGDCVTPFWFPSQTKAGAIREDRLVLPIPIGTHWRDAKPLVLPEASAQPEPVKARALPPTRPTAPAVPYARKMAIVRSQSKALHGLPPGKAAVITSGGLKYIDRGDYVPEPAPEKPKRATSSTPRVKHDPKQLAFARELRDRYLEYINDESVALPPGKYDVTRRALGDGVARAALSAA